MGKSTISMATKSISLCQLWPAATSIDSMHGCAPIPGPPDGPSLEAPQLKQRSFLQETDVETANINLTLIGYTSNDIGSV
jgi:hypothetical protein